MAQSIERAYCFKGAEGRRFDSYLFHIFTRKTDHRNLSLSYYFAPKMSGKMAVKKTEMFRPIAVGRKVLGNLKQCKALRQMKKQQIKVKFWIWGPITVYCYVQ